MWTTYHKNYDPSNYWMFCAVWKKNTTLGFSSKAAAFGKKTWIYELQRGKILEGDVKNECMDSCIHESLK